MSLLLMVISLNILIFATLFYLLFRSSKKVSHLNSEVLLSNKELKSKQEEQQKLFSELLEIKDKFDKTAMHDPVTELPSRLLFEDRLKQVFEQSKRYNMMFGILFLDIDGFKDINDALGYEIGDELLKTLAQRLNETIRQVDTICRFSGDEFVFILPQLTKIEACAYVAQRLLEVISVPFTIKDHELFVTASIGIAVYPSDGEEQRVVLKSADNALHQAKLRGSNSYQFYKAEMQELSRRELLLRSHLGNASVYKEFSVFYQPIINIKTKEILSMEALLRWEHPDFGLITPKEFIRLAENSGKILMLGEWVLRTVCEQYNTWIKEGFRPGKIAINISWKQFENPHFIYRLTQVLQEFNMAPGNLVFEISETVLLNRVDVVEKSLKLLKNLGIQTAIDDFGTGHLSLLRLQQFPVDYLKIDGSLVQQMHTTTESKAITKMIISLAESLHLQAVAEGVETLEQKQKLEEMGCFVMQGHLFSYPKRPEEFTKQTTSDILSAAK